MKKKPNILVIVTDQQRADLIGASGRVPVHTPAIDRLCAEGVLFERAYTPCPLCTPARATLLSGQYPSRHRAWSIGVDAEEQILSLPAILSTQAGYKTALIGKSHFRSCLCEGSLEAMPKSRDFEFFKNWNGPWFGHEYACLSIGHTTEPHAYSMHYGLWLQEQGVLPELPFFDPAIGEGMVLGKKAGRWDLPEKYNSSTWVADQSMEYIHRHSRGSSDAPFYLSVNFSDPHRPFRVPEPWDTLHDDAVLSPPVRKQGEWEDKPTLYQAAVDGTVNEKGWSDGIGIPCQGVESVESETRSPEEEKRWRIYMGMQSLLDKNVGRILQTLEEEGIADDTLVIYTSDHGDHMGDHYLWSKGGSHYDAAVRVPFIVRWPGHTPAGERSRALQSLVDIPVSILTAAGLPPCDQMQGVDQTATWKDPRHSSRESVLIDHRVEQGLYVHSLITDRYRLSAHSILAESRDELELYDLQEDPDEFHDLSKTEDHLAKEMLLELLRYRAKISGPWPSRGAFA